MKQNLKKLLLVALLCVPWVTHAQNLTVANGTTSNAYVPFYGNYADYYNKSQIVYPADSLTAMQGQTIFSLTFYATASNVTWSGNTYTIKMGIVNDATASATWADDANFTTVYTGSIAVENGLMTFDLGDGFAYTGGNLMIQFTGNGSSYSSSYFYGVSRTGASYHAYNVSATPSSGTAQNFLPKLTFEYGTASNCMRPSDLTVEDVTPYSIDISWTAGGSETSWLVSDGTNQTVVTTTSHTFTGLTPNTEYEIYVRAICGSTAGDTSRVLGTTVRTACAPMTTLPYTYDFEDAVSGSNSGAMPSCWDRLWDGNPGSAYGYYPYVYNYNYYSHSGVQSLYFYNYDYAPYGSYQMAIMPEVSADDFEINTLALSFWARKSNAGADLLVGVISDPTDITTFVVVDTVSGLTDQYRQYDVYFDSYEGDGGRIAMMVTNPGTGTYASSSAYVDDVTLAVSTCKRPDPNSLSVQPTSNSITATWTPVGEEQSWHVKLGEMSVEVYEPMVEFTDLPEDSAFLLQVAALCDNGDTSLYISRNVRTFCAPIAESDLPYEPDFGAMQMSLDSCWTVGHLGTTSSTYLSTVQGDTSLYFYYGSSASGATWAVMPLFETPVNELAMTFWLLGTSSGSYGSIEVGVMTDPDDLSTFTSLRSFRMDNANEWKKCNMTFANYQGEGGFIAFRSQASYGTYLKDIMVRMRPDCPGIESVTLGTSSPTSAFVQWTLQQGYDVEPDDYNLTLKQQGSVLATATTSDLYYMFNGLVDNSTYTVVVAPACGSMPADIDSVTFSTGRYNCEAVDNTVTNIDTVGTSTSTSYYLPSYSSYKNSFSQQIYLNTELESGEITSFSIMPAAVSQQRHFKIYMAHTTQSTLTSFINADDMTLVFDGQHDSLIANQWLTFQLTTPFMYNGGDNLLVTIIDSNNSYQYGNTFYSHAISGNSRYVYSDGTYYNINSIPTGGTSTANRDNALFGIHPCNSVASCANPLLIVTETSPSEITFVWGAGGAETEWDVDYRQEGDTVWTNLYTGTSLSQHTLTGLPSDVTYQIRVSHECNGVVYSKTLTASTACETTTVPFFEDFSTWTTGVSGQACLPSCWHSGTSYSYGDNYPYIYTYYSLGDGKSLNMYASATDYTYLALPKFEAPADTLLISFAVYRSGSYYQDQVSVGVMTDPYDISTYQESASFVTSTINGWEFVEAAFVGMPDGHLAIVNPTGSTGSFYIENISVTYFNPCIRPYDVAVDNITTSSAMVSWQDSATTNFVVEYGPQGFIPGNGTAITAEADSVMLTGLSHSTFYDVYVRGVCDDGDSSNWSFVQTFATDCGPISLPYSENYDNWGSLNMPYCYTSGSDYSTGYPYLSSYYNHSVGGSKSLELYAYDYNSGSQKTWFFLPAVESTVNVNTLQTRFWIYAADNDMPVIVGVNSTPDTAGMTIIDTVYTVAGDWTEQMVSFDTYTGTGKYIGYYTYCNPQGMAELYLDDLTVEQIPTCAAPTQLVSTPATSTSVSLSWHNRTAATQWVIEYGPRGFVPGTGTTAIANSNPYLLTLPASYQGEFYVRTICGAGDTGAYSFYPGYMEMQQIPATLPYSYNFETETEWNNWQSISNYSGINWHRGTATSGAGSYSAYVSTGAATYTPYDYNRNINAALYRDVDFGTVDSSYTITFKARAGGSYNASYDLLALILVPSDEAVTTSNAPFVTPWGPLNDHYLVQYVRVTPEWQTYSASFDTISGTHRVAFCWVNQNNDANSYSMGDYIHEACAIDDITIDYSSCPRPLSLTVSNVTGSTAEVDWSGDASSDYQIIYRPYPSSADNNHYVSATGTHYMITGLNSLTQYAVWVRKVCGVGDTSLACDGMLFSTDFCNNVQMVTLVDSTASESTTYYAPVSNYYRNGVAQIIIERSEFDTLEVIDGIGFNYGEYEASSSKNNVAMYLMPYDTNSFASTADLVDLDSSAVMVYYGSLNCEAGWNYFGFMDSYVLPDSGNLLLVIVDNSNAYDGSYSTKLFRTRSTVDNKMIAMLSDSEQFDPSDLTSSTAYKNLLSYRPEMRFHSCANVCPTPSDLTVSAHSFADVTVNWQGNGTQYEVAVKPAASGVWPAAATVGTTSYNATGLQPATEYTLRVRNVCDADADDYSDWATLNFTTDSLPCFAPTGLATTDLGYTSVVFGWTPGATTTSAELHVWNTTFDTVLTVNGSTATLAGLTQRTDYYAAVSALCGNGIVQSDYSDTIPFTTQTCQPVTGVTASNVQQTTAQVSWTGTGVKYSIEYGLQGFGQGTGTTINDITGTSYTLTGLDPDESYDVYVRNYCTNADYSTWSAPATFTTPVGIDGVEGASVRIYPNPTTDATTVTLSGVNGEVTIAIVDMNGRTVATETMSCEGDCAKTMEVSGLASGAYFVRISGDNLNKVQKLIVK